MTNKTIASLLTPWTNCMEDSEKHDCDKCPCNNHINVGRNYDKICTVFILINKEIQNG